MTIEVTKRKLDLTGIQIKHAKAAEGIRRNQVPNLRYGKIAMSVDADVDGSHICGLNLNFFHHFWPELVEAGFVHYLRTPVVLVTLKDKSELEFFTEREYKEWEAGEGQKIKGWSKKYYKGLSSWKTNQFAKFLENPDKYLYKITANNIEDIQAIDLAFNKDRADDRKAWLETPAANFEDFIGK